MICVLIPKLRETDKGKWVSYSTLKGKQWYSVKFVKECAPPRLHEVAQGVYRGFIDLQEEHEFNVATEGKYKVLYVETYGTPSADSLKRAMAAETKRIEAYRAEREAERMDFLAPDVDDMPF